MVWSFFKGELELGLDDVISAVIIVGRSFLEEGGEKLDKDVGDNRWLFMGINGIFDLNKCWDLKDFM